MFVRAIVHSVYLYGLAFIRLKQTHIDQLNSALRGVWRKILNAPSFTSTVDLMMELGIIPLNIQHQSQLMRFMARLQSKPNSHLVKKLFNIVYINKAISYGALTKQHEAHPYVMRPIALQYRELLGQWSTDNVTQHNPIVWPRLLTIDYSKIDRNYYIKQLNLITKHAALVQYASERKPDEGLSLIKLSAEERQIVQLKHLRDLQQQNKEIQRKLIIDSSNVNSVQRKTTRHHSLIKMKPLLMKRQLTLQFTKSSDDSNINTNTIKLAEQHILPKTSYLKDELYMKYDNPYISRQRALFRLNRVPTYYTLKKYVLTDEQIQLLGIELNTCRGCKQLVEETREHILLHCIKHSTSRQLLFSKLQKLLIDTNNNQTLTLQLILGNIQSLNCSRKSLIKPTLNWTEEFIKQVCDDHPIRLLNSSEGGYIQILGKTNLATLKPP